ncbi:MAG TPA: hypothetical protein VE263_05565, partial [Candidatus Angelobacter sp.]|nr:hypothetical protein [Candidatus Angelobacter sp.]
RRGDAGRAQSACTQALAIGLPEEFRPKAQRDLAQLTKREGKHERAAEIWEELVDDPQDGVHACEQLAIHYERRAGDVARAIEYAKLGLQKIRGLHCTALRVALRDPYLAAKLTRMEKKFTKRLTRLERKSLRPFEARRLGLQGASERKAKPGLW